MKTNGMNVNTDLVANPFDQLALVIANFDHDAAPDEERTKCIAGIKAIAQETVRRYKLVTEKEAELDRRLANVKALEAAHSAFALVAGTPLPATPKRRLWGLRRPA